MIGYQFGSVDGPYSGTTVGTNINGPYIDGISFTHSSPRQHIWSFIVALDEAGHIQQSTCDCTNRNFCGFSASSFVVTDYLCDTESKESFVYPFILYLTIQYGMVLGVAQDSECCTFQPPPPPPLWFYRKLRASTDNNIDTRVHEVTDEDVLLVTFTYAIEYKNVF